MFRLVERTSEQGVAHHCANPVRIYETDSVQARRIERSRAMLAAAIAGRECSTVLELGAGTADISGHFSEEHEVIIVDCHEDAVAEAKRRFPNIDLAVVAMLENYPPCSVDVLVLCEVLEHIADPKSLVCAWLPHATACVISHPIDEPFGSTLSGGDHCWSFSLADFHNWFAIGGHKLVEQEMVEVGQYRVMLGRGVALDSAPRSALRS